MSKDTKIITFPFSRMAGSNRNKPLKELGFSKRCLELDPSGQRGTGHWCSYCQGVWYGATFECECPVCGNRQG